MAPLTVEHVRQRLEEIKTFAGDSEAAHGAEDKLHQDILRAIAEGAADGPELAKAGLETLGIDFERWCA